MTPKILFRIIDGDKEEIKVAKKYFDVVGSRSLCKDNLVIPRYSALPFYRELETDLIYQGCKLINSYNQHRWIADFEWYEELKEFTPETWNEQEFPNSDYEGKFVVKGRTNSKKHNWNRLMFAENRKQAIRIASELSQDGLIGDQGIIYRKYVPLKILETGIAGLPFANEWRFFFLGTKCVAYGYYWSISSQGDKAKMDDIGIEFANKIALIASEYVNFFVLDIAEKEEGGWILIEVNDGSMSGLSEINLDIFYSNLRELIGFLNFN